jgi:L-2-hydroxyglutarate oxidase LhgO
MDSVDCVVVGAGVVGLAIARALAERGLETIVVEAQRHIGMGESSRNSEVIHAGIYYPEESLKARFCVAGRKTLYEYCKTRGVAHRRCGKLIVATTADQVDQLAVLRAFAEAAGVHDLTLLTETQARRLEPDLRCVAALESPSTGIIDSHAYMLSLQGDAEAAGAALAFEAPVTRLSQGSRAIGVTLGNDSAPSLQARLLVNSAGLCAQTVALSLAELPRHHVPPLHYAKGNYFSLSSRSPFTRLIYPLPQASGLGIHLTLDLDGRARFGPDVEWIDAPDYHVDSARSPTFYDAIRTYWPALRDRSLLPGYAGVRAKLSGPGEKAADFVISGPGDHGIPGLINLFGIDSPGLTSSLALAAHVTSMAEAHIGSR